ncbi:unnamed protein product, partial [Phaeothamnion confervicola]
NGKGAASPGNGAEPVDYGPLDQWLGFNLRLAQTASFASFARLSKEVGERPGRMAMLRLIAQNPGISQTALSRANGRDKSTLTPLLTDFARRGLVRRTRTRNDKRTYRLTLTPAGERLLAQLHACAQVHERQLDEVIGPRDRVRFLAILRKIAAEMA